MNEMTNTHIVSLSKRQELIQATYGIVGCVHEVYRQLGGGLPEYIYQEALATELTINGYIGRLFEATGRTLEGMNE